MASRRALLHALAATAAMAGTPFSVQVCSQGQQVFDTAALSCATCPAAYSAASNATVDALGSSEACACMPGYTPQTSACSPSTATTCSPDQCTSCAAFGLAPSRTQSGGLCMACDNITTAGLGANGDCSCGGAGATSTSVLVETTKSGALLAAKQCLACPPRSLVFLAPVPLAGIAANAYACVGCADPAANMTASGACVCDFGYRSAGVLGVFPWSRVRCIPAAVAAAVLSQYAESAAISVSYFSLQSSSSAGTTSLTGLSSVSFQDLYLPAAAGCLEYKTGTPAAACQALANLCVLQLFQPSTTVCALFVALYSSRKAAVHGFQGWAGAGLPFLYYQPSEASAIATDAALTAVMSFSAAVEPGTSDTLQLYLAKYALNGTFLGLELLRDQLEDYCAAAALTAAPAAAGAGGGGTASAPSSVRATPWLNFGYGYSSATACDLSVLMAAAAATDPVFYDLYIRDLAADAVEISADAAAAGSASSASSSASASAANPFGLPLTLYPVPVVVVNYRAADGSTPNVDTSSAQESNDVYVRRFMLADAVSGVTAAGARATVLRYASSLRLTVTARLDGSLRPNTLLPPVLTVTYTERLTSDIAAAAAASSGSFAAGGGGLAVDTLSFAVEYTADSSAYGRTVLALAVSLGMLVCGWAAVRLTAWIRMNARDAFEAAASLLHIAKLFEALVTAFAAAYFWFLWAITLYWLVFFKLQTQVFILLPPQRPAYSDNQYIPFEAALVTVFLCYLVRVALLVWYQVRCDLFFVDWEKPRGALVRTGAEHEAALGKQVAPGLPNATVSGAAFAPISIWRTIHAANEWSRLQTARRLRLPLVLLVLVALMEAGGLQYVATPRPNAHNLAPGAINPLLQFANNVFWWLVVAGVQLLWTVAVHERYVAENPSARFIDVCTVAKVSLLVMDAKYHGYYLHANAPHEHADGPMRELGEHLFEEAAAMRVGRGLPGSLDAACQTFELHVPALWREMYDRVYRRLVDQESQAVNAMYGGGGAMQQMQAAVSFSSSSQLAAAGGPGGPGGASSLTALSAVAKVKERTRRLAAAFGALTAFLQGFIEETDPDYKRVWRERTLVQQVFDLPPDMMAESLVMGAGGGGAGGGLGLGGGGLGIGGVGGGGRLAYLMLDRVYRFERVVFRGIELDLLVWDILVYCFTDYWQQSPTIAAIVTYIAARALAWLRERLGDRNTAYKTLVDERFLK